MMRNLSLRRMSLAALGATLLLTACGGAPQEPAAQEPGTESPPAAEVTAQRYPECDPAYHCRVPSQYVQCMDGIVMFAWSNPEGGYCIERGVCDRHGGPTVCPYE
jgi:hypothetical protein